MTQFFQLFIPPTRWLSTAFWLILSFACYLAQEAESASFERGKKTHISNLHQIESDLYIWSEEFRLDGYIDGDLSCAATSIEMNGVVTGSAQLAGMDITFSGRVDRSLRCLAAQVELSGTVARDLLVAAEKVSLARSTVVQRDAWLAGESIDFDGVCQGSLKIYATVATITGTVDQNVTITADSVVILPPMTIGGDLKLVTPKDIALDTLGVSVTGRIDQERPEPDEDADSEGLTVPDIIFSLALLMAAFLFGFLASRLFQPHFEEAFQHVRNRTSVSFATGILTLLITVVCLVALVGTSAMAVLGLILLEGESVVPGMIVMTMSLLILPLSLFATVIGGLSFYTGGIAVAFVIGHWIARRIGKPTRLITAGQLFLGLLAVTIASLIPVVGMISYVTVSLVGCGGVVLAVRNLSVSRRALQAPLPIPPESPSITN